MINKCGKEDDHLVNDLICKEIGISDREIPIMNAKILKNNPTTAKSDSYAVKFCAYCDQRVVSTGIVPMMDRLEELKARHQKREREHE